MKTYRIYGESYELKDSCPEPVDAFAIKGELCDEDPGGKQLGFITMEDGSIIDCRSKFNPVPLIVIAITLLLITVCAFIFLTKINKKSIDVGGVHITGRQENNIIQYNGFMAMRDGSVNIDFTNGDYPATISLSGEGIQSESISVEPNGYVGSLKVTTSTDAGVINAQLTITTETSQQTTDVIVEIPENNTPNSSQGLEGYWKGEFIYGPNTVE